MPLLTVVGTDVKVGTRFASDVGDGGGVIVDVGVGSGVSVGGMGVFVGMAACVSATIVNAAETAVDCISAGLMVGSAGVAPHALTTIARTVMVEIIKIRFMVSILSPFPFNNLGNNCQGQQ